ncbi:MAG: hypothetical protein RBT75_15505 [Anaerolineae bacterium]|jgi:hypothetical protein|nr:hypothetical protein [Anaerolineae bacterium]
MSFDIETLYALLPAIYRIRDAERGGELKALLSTIADEIAVLEENLDQLYDDQFIETCAEWVVPYIGDALGIRALNTDTAATPYSLRAYVANTIAYRRRKGTLAVLEQLARDVTRWPARAIEFFSLLSTTQHLEHLRPPVVTVDLDDENRLNLLDTPFDTQAHTGEVRRIANGRGKYNIPNVGLFVYRLKAYPITHAPAPGADGRYHFSALGCDLPLFHQPVTEAEITHLAEEINVPAPIRPFALQEDLRGFQQPTSSNTPEYSAYYGAGRSLAVYRDKALAPPSDIVVSDLTHWHRPCAGKVAIDPRLGRLAFAEGETPASVEVSYHYGFSADIGGGSYDRQKTLTVDDDGMLVIEISKSGTVKTLQAAHTQWEDAAKPNLLIRILDNAVYGGVVKFVLPEHTHVIIEAADGVFPTVRTIGGFVVSGPETASFTLNGVRLQGALFIEGDLTINLIHTTLVPGRLLMENGAPLNPDLDSLRSESTTGGPTVTLDRCIVGPLRLPATAGTLVIRDSIVDGQHVDGPQIKGAFRPALAANDAGDLPGPALILERSTVFGPVHVQTLDASNALFSSAVMVERQQLGCMRFCYVPWESKTPRRYRCQPDLALSEYAQAKGKMVKQLSENDVTKVCSRMEPRFLSCRYSCPAYAQLGAACAEEIRRGAEDGAEMGVFNHLKQPQREANLRSVLREYLRFGLEAGIFYVT